MAGDANGDGDLDLVDALAALVLAGGSEPVCGCIDSNAGVDERYGLGIPEASYILRRIVLT